MADWFFDRYHLEAKTIKGYQRIEGGNLFHVRSIELIGSCCIAIYNNYNFRGLKHMMMPGFDIVPKFSKILSFKFGYCNDVSWINKWKRSRHNNVNILLTFERPKLFVFPKNDVLTYYQINRGGGPGWAEWAAAHPIFEGKPLREEKIWHKMQNLSL